MPADSEFCFELHKAAMRDYTEVPPSLVRFVWLTWGFVVGY